jgi:hypothetical protein
MDLPSSPKFLNCNVDAVGKRGIISGSFAYIGSKADICLGTI